MFSIEEAASRLGISEPIVVRLSQYFKVPVAHYQASGEFSLFGNDELTFEEKDISFFQQVQAALVTGMSLESIKEKHLQGQFQPGVIENHTLYEKIKSHLPFNEHLQQSEQAAAAQPQNTVYTDQEQTVIDVPVDQKLVLSESVTSVSEDRQPHEATTPVYAPVETPAEPAFSEPQAQVDPDFQENFWTRWANPVVMQPWPTSPETRALLKQIHQELFA